MHISPSAIWSDFGSESISYQEYLIIKLLISNRNNVVPREVFFYTLWGDQGENSRLVDMHISHLRKKIKKIAPDHSEAIIHSAYKYGYFLHSEKE